MVCRGTQRRIEHDLFVVIGASIIAVDAMNIEMASHAEAEEEISTFDIPDAVLERAGTAEQTAFTLFYCTNQSSECGLRD
jgi:hypothetical protein